MTQGEPPPAYISWSKIKIKLQGQLQGQLPGRFYALKWHSNFSKISADIRNEGVQPISFLFFKHDHYPLAKCEDLHICSFHYVGSSSIIAGKWCGTFVHTTFNSHLKSDINTNKRQPLFRLRDRYQYLKCLITISRPISILILWRFRDNINTISIYRRFLRYRLQYTFRTN